MLTHHNIVNNGQFLARGFHYTERDRICVPVPLFHCYGCVIGTMTALNTGAALVFPNSTFDARATLVAIQSEACTSVYGVPAMYVAELAVPDFAAFNLTSLRTGMMSGAPCPIELMKRVLADMHIAELVIAYGQTECSPVVTMSDADDPDRHPREHGRARHAANRNQNRLHHQRHDRPHRRAGRSLCAWLRGHEGL